MPNVRDALVLLIRYLVLLVIGSAVLIANPWKLGDWTQYYSGATIHRLLAFHQDWSKAPKMVVVLADDRYLQSGDGMRDDAARWPLPYAAWASVLRLSEKADARAVFFDFTMADVRPDETFPPFVAALEKAARRMPVFIVAGSPEIGVHQIARPELLAAARRQTNIRFVSAISGVREPPALPAYRLAPDAAGRPSAAAAMLPIVCGANCGAAGIADEIELTWAAPPSGVNCELRQGPSGAYDGCTATATGAFSRAFQMLVLQPLRGPCRLLFPSWADHGCLPQGEAVLSNVFTPEITLADFLSGSNAKLRQTAVSGAVVMVGLDFALARDRVVTPVYGSIPAVHAHAMALTDLTVLGQGTLRSPGGDDDRKAARDVASFGWVLLLAYCVQLAMRRLPARRRFGAQHWTRGFRPALVIAVIFGELLLLWSSQPPSNWLGLLGTVSFVQWMIDRPAAAVRIRSALGPYWRRAGVVARRLGRAMRA